MALLCCNCCVLCCAVLCCALSVPVLCCLCHGRLPQGNVIALFCCPLLCPQLTPEQRDAHTRAARRAFEASQQTVQPAPQFECVLDASARLRAQGAFASPSRAIPVRPRQAASEPSGLGALYGGLLAAEAASAGPSGTTRTTIALPEPQATVSLLPLAVAASSNTAPQPEEGAAPPFTLKTTLTGRRWATLNTVVP